MMILFITLDVGQFRLINAKMTKQMNLGKVTNSYSVEMQPS